MIRTYPGCTVIRVVDGDTVWVMVDLGFDLYRRTNVRLARCDTPELFHIGGLAAKAGLSALLPVTERVTLISEKVDSFGRAIGELILPDGRNVTDEMVAQGYAVYRTY